jgi:hypothetical protein
MTSDRARAYARVTRTIEDLGPAKLLELERRRVRASADALLFADARDYRTLDALADIEHLTRHLVSCERWTAERAGRLADDVAACGPDWFEVGPLAQVA